MKRVAAALLLLVLAGGGIAAYSIYQRIDAPYRGFSGDEQFVDVPSGASTAAIGRALIDAGVIADDLTFRATLWVTGDARRLRAGEYRFTEAATPRDVIARIVRGDVARASVTFPEGLTIAEMSVVAARAGFGTAAEFVSAARNGALVQDLDPQARDLEGYLFPDTYSVPRRTTAADLVQVMVNRFKEVFSPALREETKARGFTVRQLIALSSIVEKETGNPAERPQVAAVYANRLRIGMPLQCDPTVIYALVQAGTYDGNLRRDDLQFDSPYNTYRYPGLPPGPIAAPGKASIEAALRPADVPYLYFVSRNDGSHAFARSLDEHNRNVDKFQVRYFRQRRLAQSP